MRRDGGGISLFLAPLGALLAACGGAAPVVSEPVAPPPLAVSAPSPVAPPFDFVLPAGAAVIGSFDVSQANLASALKLLDGRVRTVVESLVPQLRTGTVPEILDSIGIDPERPLTFAETRLGADGLAAIASLRHLVPESEPGVGAPTAPPPGLYAAPREALDGVTAVATYRVLLPTKNPARLRGTLDAVFSMAGWKPSSHGEYSSAHAIATVTGEEGIVAFDLAVGSDPRKALDGLRASTHTAHEDAPPLEHDALRIAYVPSRVAEIGFLSGAGAVAGALSGASIEASIRERIAAQGLWEAAQNLVAAVGTRGDRFSRIEVRVSPDPMHTASTVRAEPGPGFEGPPDSAWQPTFSVLPTPIGDVSRPFLESWKVPGGPKTALEGKAFLDWSRNGGWTELLAATPDLMVSGAEIVATYETSPDPALLSRLARFGQLHDSSGTGLVFFGVLPEGSPRAVAECILVGTAPCGARKLTLGSARKDGTAYARLIQVDGHFVLLRGPTAAALTLKLGGVSAPPVRVEVSVEKVTDLPFKTLIGSVKRDGTTLVFELLPK